jgi:hypothetical protein
MTAADAWDELAPGFSPFKVVCGAHPGSQLVERGGAVEAGDGFVVSAWKPRADRTVPETGSGVRHADGSRTFTLECPRCRRPKEIRQDSLIRLLRDGQADAKGRVVLDLSDLGF